MRHEILFELSPRLWHCVEIVQSSRCCGLPLVLSGGSQRTQIIDKRKPALPYPSSTPKYHRYSGRFFSLYCTKQLKLGLCEVCPTSLSSRNRCSDVGQTSHLITNSHIQSCPGHDLCSLKSSPPFPPAFPRTVLCFLQQTRSWKTPLRTYSARNKSRGIFSLYCSVSAARHLVFRHPRKTLPADTVWHSTYRQQPLCFSQPTLWIQVLEQQYRYRALRQLA